MKTGERVEAERQDFHKCFMTMCDATSKAETVAAETETSANVYLVINLLR